MIKRDFYLNELIKNMWNGDIKVITGIRRCGKSVLLFELFKNYLLETGLNKNQIVEFKLDQRKYYTYRNPIKLADEVEKIVNGSKNKYYLFVDEIQLTMKVKDSESNIEISIYDLLNELKSYSNLDVYVTGSNSKMLSKDIITEFRGRSTQIHIYPLSFEEFINYRNIDPLIAINEYLLYGGMPRAVQMSDSMDKIKYLTSLYNEVYIKDIVERYHIEKELIMSEILDYLSSQIGSLTNPTNIANVISQNRKEKISTELVSSYISHAEDSFLLNTTKRYDIKGKSYFKFPNKYYFVDLGLRNARLNFRQYDPGHLMENAVYNELIRRGYSVDVGVVTDRRKGANTLKEIDFIVNFGDKRVYIQSALRIEDNIKENNEIDSFKLTNDFFKKIIVRNDISHNYYDDYGFYHCNLIDFLLGKIDLF